MTQEDKALLLKDLCARLPYGVKVWSDRYQRSVTILYAGAINEVKFSETGGIERLDTIKPYLRPMSSMTEEEVKEIQKINWQFGKSKSGECYVGDADDGYCSVSQMVDILGYLNEHHFDYRGLIEKGLSLEAPADMYKTE